MSDRPAQNLDSRRDQSITVSGRECRTYFNFCVHLNASAYITYIQSCRYPFQYSLIYLSLKAANITHVFYPCAKEHTTNAREQTHAIVNIYNDGLETNTFSLRYYPDYFDFLHHAGNNNGNSQHAKARWPLSKSIIEYTFLPHIHFTQYSHDRHLNGHNTAPQIAFGKYEHVNNEQRLPLAINFSTTLTDVGRVTQYIHLLQSYLNRPGACLAS